MKNDTKQIFQSGRSHWHCGPPSKGENADILPSLLSSPPTHPPSPAETEAVISAPLRLALMTEKCLPCFELMVTSFTIKCNSVQETLPIFFDFSNRKSNSKFGFHYSPFHSEMDLKT